MPSLEQRVVTLGRQFRKTGIATMTTEDLDEYTKKIDYENRGQLQMLHLKLLELLQDRVKLPPDD